MGGDVAAGTGCFSWKSLMAWGILCLILEWVPHSLTMHPSIQPQEELNNAEPWVGGGVREVGWLKQRVFVDSLRRGGRVFAITRLL